MAIFLFDPLTKVPGPFWARVTNWWSVYFSLTYKQHEVEHAVHKKYGHLVHYAPNISTFDDPKMLPIVYHRYADRILTSMELTALIEEEDWLCSSYGRYLLSTDRGTNQKVFTTRSLNVNSLFNGESDPDRVQEFQAKMDDFAKGGGENGLAEWSHFFAYDVISELTFGGNLVSWRRERISIIFSSSERHELARAELEGELEPARGFILLAAIR
ncbi:hypothetical protein BDZ91DRAFT_796716 [Kalaharituber pfeilii]|nr:hypothetical protein BDZ91DRAFT_796716 [Kalaharituber pfeilii]